MKELTLNTEMTYNNEAYILEKLGYRLLYLMLEIHYFL